MDAKENVIRLIADKHISQEALKLLISNGVVSSSVIYQEPNDK